MTHDLIKDLRDEIKLGHVLVVVGAGVSIGATGNPLASWQGLLEDGVEQCVAIWGFDAKWANRVREEIRSGYRSDLLSAAEKVSTELGFPEGGEYRRWLRKTVGSLEAKNLSVLEALRDLNLPLATTNYDGLLEEITSRPPVTWADGDKAIRVIRREEEGILHLHGYWDDPKSVVLGIRSYEQILRDEHAQAVLRALQTLKTFLFVGCGEGLVDPNFGALLSWAREVFKDVGGRHYRLCKEDELAALRTLHKDDYLFPLSYGPNHADLGPFLRTLSSSSPEDIRPRPDDGSTPPVNTPTLRLPGRPRCFGRADEVRDLIETLLQPSPPPTPLLGGPGVGKTTISLEALHDQRVAERFGTRRFFVRCDSAKSREDLVGAIVRTIGLKHGPDVEGRLFADLAKAPAALVLDNAETPWEGPDKAAVGELLTDLGSIPNLALIASIRGNERPWGPSWREAIQVGPLQLDAARKAFLDKAGRKFENDPDLDSLLEEVDRLAIAVVLLGYHAQVLENVAELRKHWQSQRTAFLQRDGGQGRLENVEVSIELSISGPRMTPEARRLLSVLSHLPDGAATEDVEALLLGRGSAASLVLRKVGLAFNQGPRLRVLAPVREYVRKQYPPQEEDLKPAMEHYLTLAKTGEHLGRLGGAETASRLAPELGNLDSMILLGLSRNDPEMAVWAAHGLGKFIAVTGWGSRNSLERALAASQASGRADLEAACLTRLGYIAFYRSDHDTARTRYEQALALYERIGDVKGEANCIESLGDIALARSDHDDARAHYEKALPLYQRIDSVLGEAGCFISLGDIALRRSDYSAAHTRYQEALSLYRRAGSVLGEAGCIQGLGDIALDRADYDGAHTLYQEALLLYRQVGSVLGEANCIRGLGEIAFHHSDHDGARSRYEEALTLYRRVDYVLGEANCIQGLGDVALEGSSPEMAGARFAEALGLYQSIQDPFSIGWAHVRLARLAPEDSEERRSHFRAAQAAWESIKRPDLVDQLQKGFGEKD